MTKDNPPLPPPEVSEGTLIDTYVSCEEILSDLEDDVFGLLRVMGSNVKEEASPSEDVNKDIQPEEPANIPEDEIPQPEEPVDSDNRETVDDELKGEDIIELGDDEHAEYAYPVLKDPECAEDGIMGDKIQPSQTLETQGSEDEYHAVEGAYDEEDGQEIVYEKKMDWNFPTEPKKQRFIFWGVVAFLVLLVVVLSATLSGRGGKPLAEVEAENNEAEESGVPSGTANGSPIAPFIAPVAIPGPEAPAPVTTTATDPTAAPAIATDPVEALLFSVSGSRLYEEGSPQSRAFQVIANEPAQEDDAKTLQRYASMTLFASLVEGDFPEFIQDTECFWSFVNCVFGTVFQLKMSNLGLTGSIPPEIGALTALTKVDMSSNSIQGSIPEEFFGLETLQELYLNTNQLTGTISGSLRNMDTLKSLYLGQNLLTGGLPSDLPNTLRAMSFYKNKLDGEIPDGLLDSNSLFYVDLSFNSISGELPANPTAPNLRHFYLSHNQLQGEIPRGYEDLEDFFADHNQFSGAPPTNFNKDLLSTLKLQGNNFDEQVDVCDLDVFSQGVLIDLAADCAICTCEGRLCEDCF